MSALILGVFWRVVVAAAVLLVAIGAGCDIYDALRRRQGARRVGQRAHRFRGRRFGWHP